MLKFMHIIIYWCSRCGKTVATFCELTGFQSVWCLFLEGKVKLGLSYYSSHCEYKAPEQDKITTTAVLQWSLLTGTDLMDNWANSNCLWRHMRVLWNVTTIFQGRWWTHCPLITQKCLPNSHLLSSPLTSFNVFTLFHVLWCVIYFWPEDWSNPAR